MSEPILPKDNIESLLESIEHAEDDFKNHRLTFDAMEETVKELKMRVELVKMKEVLKKIGGNKPKKTDDSDKPKGLRETLKQEKPNEIPAPQ